MKVYKNMFLFFVIFAIAVMAAITTLPRLGYNSLVVAVQEKQERKEIIDNDQGQENEEMPVAIYGASEPSDPEQRALRQANSRCYDNSGAPPIEPDITESRLVMSHWWWRLSALPVAQSDAVVLGEVIDAQAYMSNDKTDVYSEFTVRIEKVLKNNGRGSIIPGGSIVAARRGGAVRFPSGHVQQYRINKQGFPCSGCRYVLFLKGNDQEQDLSILTGYKLRNGRVSPLDGVGTTLSFAVYEGFSERDFLNAVQDAIANPSSQTPIKKGE